MEKMFKMMNEMMDKMGGEERVEMMKKVMEMCFERMSADEKKNMMKGFMPRMGGGDAAWDMMPKMMMSMMNVMCMKMMSDMMKEGPAAGGSPRSGGPMGMGGPMRMMKNMMGGMFKEGGDEEAKETCSKDGGEAEAGSG